MDVKKLGLGLGAFAAGAAAWIVGTRRYGDQAARLLKRPATPDSQAPAAAAAAAAPVGRGEAEKTFVERPGSPAAEQAAPDLAADATVSAATRAPDAFRPDPTAVPTAEEHESLRPATGPAPTLSADRGSGMSDSAGAA